MSINVSGQEARNSDVQLVVDLPYRGRSDVATLQAVFFKKVRWCLTNFVKIDTQRL